MITGNFSADFSKFTSAVDAAVVKLKSFESDSGKVERALSRVTNAYSGTKVIQDATLAAEAIERLGEEGGVAAGLLKLTEKELTAVGAQATEAVSKMQALGQKVPEGLQRIADAAKPIPEQLTLMDRAAGLAKSSFGQMFTAFSAVSLVDKAVSSLVNFGTAAFESAGRTVDLASKLDVSTDAIQRWDFIAQQTGTTVEAFASSAFKLQTRLGGAGGSGPIAQALDDIGLSLRDLQAMAPEQQFDAVVGALSRMDDQAAANRIGVALFGKSFEQMSAAVAQGYEDMAREAPITAENQLRALDNMGDAWSKFYAQATSAAQSFMGTVVTLGQAIVRSEGIWNKLIALGAALHDSKSRELLITQQLAAQQSALTEVWKPEVIAQTGAATARYVAALADAHKEVVALKPEVRKQIDAALELGVSQTDIAERFEISEAALRIYTAQTKENEKTTDAAREATKKWNESYRTLDSTMARWVQTGQNANITTRSTMDLYTAMPAAIASADEGLKSDFIPATQMSADALMGLATVGQTSMLNLGKSISSQNLTGSVAKIESQFKKLGKNISSSLGPTILSAVTGGGNVGDAVGTMIGGEMGTSLVKGIGGTLTKTLGATFGGALNAVLPGIGSLLGSLGGKLMGKLFGPSEHEKVNDMRDALVKAGGGFEALNTKAFEAGTTLKGVLDARTVKDYEAAVAELEKKMGSFAAEREADQQRLTDAIEKYGFKLAELGPQMQASRLNEQAKELIEDWRVLVGAGIDVANVNAKMSESVSAYMQQAISVGAEVPNAMRPILESMVEQGTLVDANGKAITDLEGSGVKFSQTMTEGFDRVVKKLDELITKLQGAGSTISSIPDLDIGVNYYNASGLPAPPELSMPGYATGTQGRLVDFAQGTPVMLHGRERVQTEAEVRADAASVNALAEAVAGLPRQISHAVSRAVTDSIILAH